MIPPAYGRQTGRRQRRDAQTQRTYTCTRTCTDTRAPCHRRWEKDKQQGENAARRKNAPVPGNPLRQARARTCTDTFRRLNDPAVNSRETLEV